MIAGSPSGFNAYGLSSKMMNCYGFDKLGDVCQFLFVIIDKFFFYRQGVVAFSIIDICPHVLIWI